jgi:nicotinamidase-related amidase
MPNATLLVIDMLNDFFVQQANLAAQRSRLVTAINDLIDGMRQRGHEIIWVRQGFRQDLSDAFRDVKERGTPITIEGTEGSEVLRELNRLQTDLTIRKKRYSAFFETNLDEHLASARLDFVVVCGINSHACVRMTAIDAYQRDYRVIVASDCVASYDTEHHEVTLRYLDGNIARVLSNAEILQMLEEG